MAKNKITGIDLDYANIPPNIDLDNSMHPIAVKYRKALARASNAIEGVILTAEDMEFMDSISPDISDKQFKEMVIKHLEV